MKFARGGVDLKSYLTVTEILTRKHFVNCEVIAGERGLTNSVKWVHVMEVTRINELLKGNELILSTGVGWGEDSQSCLSFLQQLISCKASGLCIELGTYTSKIPQIVIDKANECDFPIILFHEEVPFVEITQDVHSLLINQHYQMISDLEQYSHRLNQLLLTVNDPALILQCLYESTGLLVGLKVSNELITFAPEMDLLKQQLLLHYISRENESLHFTEQPIHLLGQDYAQLYVASINEALTELEVLTVDRTATALAQHFLKDLYVEEKKRVDETEWMTKWMNGELTLEQIKDSMHEVCSDSPIRGGVVVCCKWQRREKFDRTYFKLILRSIFEQEGFHLLVSERNREVLFILLNKRMVSTWRERLENSLHRWMNQYESDENSKRNAISFIGIGQYCEQLDCMHKSYETAKETISIQEMLQKQTIIHFYDDLHMYRIISLLHQHQDLQEVVFEYLQPVITYDETYNAKLMETLKIYLACNGSKQETAKRLYIVRQTLYHRIEKLEKLLGEDFMEPEKRLAIEFMIMAYEYLFMMKKSRAEFING
ncbi:PucR family transcriptional regulator ligand-binding domain-containing protein [Priestia megaterium]|uniref:PucR family transcriptional regulator n=1 Tax=Priestia megaterium TaxID=1404 RepID=UPI0021AC85B1|nr:PucR family transcriptional regulator [Priestia megaterium]MCR8928307.1 PucR family transcriptional regulator ligand-binding domain-containing protein [Priestia megaterium]